MTIVADKSVGSKAFSQPDRDASRFAAAGEPLPYSDEEWLARLCASAQALFSSTAAAIDFEDQSGSTREVGCGSALDDLRSSSAALKMGLHRSRRSHDRLRFFGRLITVDLMSASGAPLGRFYLLDVDLASSTALEGRISDFADLIASHLDRHARISVGRRCDRGAPKRYLADALETIPALLLYFDSELNCRFANKAVADWFGAEPEAVIGLPMSSVFSPALTVQCEPHFQAALQGSRREFECHLTKPERGDCYAMMTLAPLFQAGSLMGLSVLAVDISELKKAEELIRRNEAFLDRAGRVAGIGAWELDVASGKVTWSEQTRRIHEVAADFVPTRETAVGFYASEARASIEEALKNSVDAGLGWDLELPLITAVGRQIWVRCIGEAKRQGGKTTRLFGVFQEITERRAAETELRARKARYRLLADNAADMITLVDLDMKRTYVSPASIEIFGREPDHLIGTDPRELVHPEDLASVEQAFHALMSGVERAQSLHRIRHVDGGWRWVETIYKRVTDTVSHQPTGYLTAVRDVSRRHAAEESLRESEARYRHLAETMIELKECAERAQAVAEHASQVKSDFLATMSHEVRTPLNGIIGYTDLLLDDEKLDDQQRRHVERIQHAGDALLTVLNDILDFSRIEAGFVELEKTAFSIQELIEKAIAITSGSAEQKDLHLTTSIASDIPKAVLGDQSRIVQVLLNLLNNAIKFTERGCIELVVSLLCRTEDTATLNFGVSDTGIGISREGVARVFERFYQVDGSIRRKFGGTGLGLAISKSLVELMGGKIGCDSVHGKGSTFYFSLTLPVASAVEQSAHARVVRHHSNSQARILVVEDLDTNRDLVRKVLEKAGHEVDLVCDGAEAIRAVQSRSYNLVLMDIQMPGIDGFAATEAIRRLASPIRDVPIIAMTANVLPIQVQHFIRCGMDGHIGKPIKRLELYEAIERWRKPRRVPEPTTMEPGDPLDRTAYADALELFGSAGIRVFLTGLAEKLGTTSEFTGMGRDELASNAHILISEAGMLGFYELAETCRRLETDCRDGEFPAPSLTEFERQRALVLAKIKVLRQDAPPSDRVA